MSDQPTHPSPEEIRKNLPEDFSYKLNYDFSDLRKGDRRAAEAAARSLVLPEGSELTTKTQYTLAFYFSRGRREVVLILKDHPDWQRGKFNGLGGSVKPGETFEETNIREFEEECGLHVESWRKFCWIDLPHFEMQCFTATASQNDPQGIRAEKGKNESVHWVPIPDLRFAKLVENVDWLIKLAMRNLRGVTITRKSIGEASIDYPVNTPLDIVESIRATLRTHDSTKQCYHGISFEDYCPDCAAVMTGANRNPQNPRRG